MDPSSTVAEYLSLDREQFRRDIGGMQKSVNFPDARSEDFVTLIRADCGSEVALGLETCLRSEFMVDVVGLKRKRDDFEIESGSVDLEVESITARKRAGTLVVDRTLPTAPADCIDLTLDSDSSREDCVITGFVMPQVPPQVTLPGTQVEYCTCVLAQDSKSDDDECVIVNFVMPPSTLAGGNDDVVPTRDSDADDDDDDDCVITGCLLPRAVVVSGTEAEYEFRGSEFVDELRASEAEVDDFSDSEYSIESFPASVSARESDDGFNASESDDGFSAWDSDEEFSPVPEWNADDAILWGWFDARR